MRYGSVCSGIEAATVAWHSLGWIPAWFSEIEPFPCRLLQHCYPDVPNLGDMLKIEDHETFHETTIDLLVGGTPCQSFSIAGLRGGLADTRGNLALKFCRILAIKRPRWFIWENVPGVFSSFSYEEGSSRMDRERRANGREFTETADFASIIAGFRECGYSVSWRTMDAQFFGVPQRRRRVFVVGHLGDDWRPSAAVLFEPESLRRNLTEGFDQGKGVTGTLGKRTGGRSIGAEEAGGGMLIVYSIMPQNSSKDYKARQVEVMQPLTTNTGISNNGGDVILQFFQDSQSGMRLTDKAATLKTGNRPAHSGVTNGLTVRRLTPVECERLQGFPDGYTAIPGADDTPRYEGLGNSMAVPVMRWLGKRIEKIDPLFA